MIARATLLLTAALILSAPFSARAAPFDDLSQELLTGNGFEIRADGSVWDKIAETPVASTDMPYLLSRLASAKRLRALLEINNIVTRYDSDRKLSPEDKEAVRALVRQNWVVFGGGARRDFRSYFSLEELEELDKIPPRFEVMSAVTMTDPAIESVTASPPPPPVVVLSTASIAVVPSTAAVVAAARAVPTLTPLLEPPALSRGSPFAAALPAFKAEPAAAPTLPAIVAPPAAPSTAAAVSADLGTLKIWTPPAPSTTTAAAPPAPVKVAVSTIAAAAPPAPPPPPAAPEPKVAPIGEPEYDAFVAAGPYSKEGKAALELIDKRAPEYCLPLLRRTVVGAVPQIVSDGARTGAQLRAGFRRDAANPLAPPVVALSPGPLFVAVKKGLFGARDAVLLPEAPQAWADLGVARPAFDALREGAAPVSTENGDWGAVRVYADGSRRGSFTSTELAGELLEQLLLLGLSREGLDASAYAAHRWTRTARLMFEARMKDETQRDDFLDPDRRAELRGWLEHPDESDDMTAAVWSGSRLQILDPRRGSPASALEFETRARASCARSTLEDALVENSRRRAARVGALESLVDAGVVDAGAAKSAAQAAADAEEAERRRLVALPPPCPAADPALEEGLRKAALLQVESASAERRMRERKSGDESHAL